MYSGGDWKKYAPTGGYFGFSWIMPPSLQYGSLAPQEGGDNPLPGFEEAAGRTSHTTSANVRIDVGAEWRFNRYFALLAGPTVSKIGTNDILTPADGSTDVRGAWIWQLEGEVGAMGSYPVAGHLLLGGFGFLQAGKQWTTRANLITERSGPLDFDSPTIGPELGVLIGWQASDDVRLALRASWSYKPFLFSQFEPTNTEDRASLDSGLDRVEMTQFINFGLFGSFGSSR